MRLATSVPISAVLTILYLASCATGDTSRGSSQRSGISEPDNRPAVRQSDIGAGSFDRDEATIDDIAEYLHTLPETRLGGYRVLSVGQVPVAGVFRAPQSRRGETALLGLLQTDVDLAVIQAKTNGQGETEVDIQSIGRDASVVHVEEISLHVENGVPNGLRARLTFGGREEELLVLVAEKRPYILKTQLSAMTRSTLRDLDGDTRKELVQYVQVFEADGRREIIVDAFSWTGEDFVHRASVALLRRLNERLAVLETQLITPPDEEWLRRIDGALRPLDEAPPASRLLPARVVTVPEMVELTLELGLPRWELAHDIAIEYELYRMLIVLEADPLTDRPVRLVGLD